MPATILSSLKRKLKPAGSPERCGLVLASGKLIDVKNRHQDPMVGFRIGGEALDKHAQDMAGTWHTHPGKGSQLSQEDYLGFSQWPGLTHYIVGTDGVTAYRADNTGIITEVDLASD